MVQRSFSPCFFGNKVTMDFKLIFVFEIIAVFAVDAMRLRPCGGSKMSWTKNVVFEKGKVSGQYVIKHKNQFNPTSYEILFRGRTYKGRVGGCNGLKKWLNGIDCNPKGWRTFNVKRFKNVKFTMKLFRGRRNLLVCFKNA